MTKIYLIRHAEAEGNMYRRAQGRYDGKITALGYRQIDELAERFKDIHLDAVYASDLTRTQTTAQAILKYHDLPLNIDWRLRELCMGVWEGMPWGNIAEKYLPELTLFESDPAGWEVEGSEHFDDLQRRITDAVLDIASRHDKQTIALVSHGMTIRALMCAIEHVPSDKISTVYYGDNTAVSLIEAENGELREIFKNDASHLDKSTSTFARQTWWKSSTGDSKGRNNLRFQMMNPKKEKELYVSCYEDAWKAAHNGSTEGFAGNIYWESAVRHCEVNPQALWKAYLDESFAGIVELDTEYQAVNGIGWVSLCYLVPEMREKRLGIQLIGQAVAVYRSLGRKSIGLRAAESNTKALGFYEYYGFKKTGTSQGVLGPLYRLEMEL